MYRELWSWKPESSFVILKNCFHSAITCNRQSLIYDNKNTRNTFLRICWSWTANLWLKKKSFFSFPQHRKNDQQHFQVSDGKKRIYGFFIFFSFPITRGCCELSKTFSYLMQHKSFLSNKLLCWKHSWWLCAALISSELVIFDPLVKI